MSDRYCRLRLVVFRVMNNLLWAIILCRHAFHRVLNNDNDNLPILGTHTTYSYSRMICLIKPIQYESVNRINKYV